MVVEVNLLVPWATPAVSVLSFEFCLPEKNRCIINNMEEERHMTKNIVPLLNPK